MNRSLRNKWLVLGLTFILAFTMTTPAAAEGLITGDTIPAGTVFDHDAILIGQDVVIDGTVNGNVFILSNQVTINGTVDGSIIMLGQNAGIGGSVSGEVYAIALTVDIGPGATLQRDLYVASVSLTSGEASIIGRDLFAIGLDSGLNGQVGRDLHTVIGPIQLYNGLMTLLGYENLTIKLRFDTPIPTSGPQTSLANAGRHSRIRAAAPAATDGFDWGNWALKLLRNWATLFIFAMIALWWCRKQLASTAEPLRTYPWKSIGIGLLVLAGCIALIGLSMLVSVAVFAIGLGLNSLGLWQLTLTLWVLAYSALAAGMVSLWVFIVYGTKIIAIYFLAKWAFGKLFKSRSIWMDVLALLAGSLVYLLLLAIPYVGWIFNIAATAYGLGGAWLAYRATVQKRVETPVIAEVNPVIEVVEVQVAEPVVAAEPVKVVEQPVVAVKPVKPVKALAQVKPPKAMKPVEKVRKKKSATHPIDQRTA